MGNFVLQMHKLIAHKMFMLAGGTYTNEVLSLPIPSPQGSPSKALHAATKVWDSAAARLKETKSCWQSKTSSRYSGYIQLQIRKKKKKITHTCKLVTPLSSSEKFHSL